MYCMYMYSTVHVPVLCVHVLYMYQYCTPYIPYIPHDALIATFTGTLLRTPYWSCRVLYFVVNT
jgi:hypothetical protein